MITEQDLQEAIAECHGIRNPGANTCMKLAAYYTIQDHLYGNNVSENEIPSYSYAAEAPNSIEYNSDSEFIKIVKEKDINQVMEVIDELMNTLGVINPRLYNGVINKLLY